MIEQILFCLIIMWLTTICAYNMILKKPYDPKEEEYHRDRRHRYQEAAYEYE